MRRALRVVPKGAAALVAVSGGPDSTALAFLAAEARPDLALTLGHVRHGLRPDRDDLAVVRSHASFLGVPVSISEVTVLPQGEGLEAAARSQRYLALRRQARAADAGWILLGHTADDQAETLLLRMARGTGVTGLAGMAPARGGLVRPLLRLRREDVHRFVLEEGLEVVADPMNEDESVRRVVARKVVLPALAELGPDPVGALCRLAELAREDVEKLDADAAAAARRILRHYGPCAVVAFDELERLDHAIASRVIRDVVTATRGDEDPPSAAQVATVLELEPGGGVDLPGVHLARAGDRLVAAPHDLSPARQVPLEVPGETRWPPTDTHFLAVLAEDAARPQLTLELGGFYEPPPLPVDAGALPPGGREDLGRLTLGPVGGRPDQRQRLVIRSRRPGDRISTNAGTRKLQDVLVDAGIPRPVRDLLPIVVLGDRVLWVPGVAFDDEAAAAGRDEPLLHLTISG